jgi:hypothetical protein
MGAFSVWTFVGRFWCVSSLSQPCWINAVAGQLALPGDGALLTVLSTPQLRRIAYAAVPRKPMEPQKTLWAANRILRLPAGLAMI